MKKTFENDKTKEVMYRINIEALQNIKLIVTLCEEAKTMQEKSEYITEVIVYADDEYLNFVGAITDEQVAKKIKEVEIRELQDLKREFDPDTDDEDDDNDDDEVTVGTKIKGFVGRIGSLFSK